MVEDLDEGPARVAYVTRGGSVAVGSCLLCDLDPMVSEVLFPCSDLVSVGHQHTDVIQSPSVRDGLSPMKGEVVAPTGEVEVVRIGFPLDFEPKQLYIESARGG